MSSFSSRWLAYTPDRAKDTKAPEQQTVNRSEAVPTKAPPISAPALTFDALPRLPWQLERLLSAAASNVLAVDITGVPDAGSYTLAWGCSYLTGDRDEALSRLWAVYRAWQGVN